jgi:acyl transferase domain-containing protein
MDSKPAQHPGPVDPVAVIGFSASTPGCQDAERFYRFIAGKNDSVGRFPAERREDIKHVLPLFQSKLLDPEQPFFSGSFFESVDKFDNKLFNTPDIQAAHMEPEQRIFLEMVYQCLESAGYAEKIRGTRTGMYGRFRIHMREPDFGFGRGMWVLVGNVCLAGVYVGHTFNKYRMLLTDSDTSASHGNHSPFIGGRISYVFDLHGPGMMVCTGCSSSLLAVHVASQAILAGECDMAIAGGISLDLMPISCKDDIWNELGITGPDVRCKAFDESADGIAKGEGCGVVLLKRLSRAQADGDTIHGVLRSTTANHDGASQGITAPNPKAQTMMLLDAWRKAGISPTELSYIEAHGTGTHLGDPIEVNAITGAFEEAAPEGWSRKCPIGSVKTNIGHLADGAAGVVGLIKVLQMLKYETIVPTIHCTVPNKMINWDNAPVRVCTETERWPRSSTPRIAGVSAFGLLGTNVHCVVQEAPLAIVPVVAELPREKDALFVFAAMSARSLLGNLAAFSVYVRQRQPSSLHEIACTLNKSRQHSRFRYRCCIVSSTWQDLVLQMEECIQAGEDLDAEDRSAAVAAAAATAGSDARVAKVAMHRLSQTAVSVADNKTAVQVILGGGLVAWDAFYGSYRPQRVPDLPTYCFDRRRFWPNTSLPPQHAELITLQYNHAVTGTVISLFGGLHSSSYLCDQ